MSNFTPNFTKTFNFQGDTITVKFRRMKRQHMALLAPYFEESDEGLSLKFTDVQEFLDKCQLIFTDTIVSFNGLRTADGEEITESHDLYETEVLSGTYFQELLMEMTTELINQSSVSKSDMGKSSFTRPEDSEEVEA